MHATSNRNPDHHHHRPHRPVALLALGVLLSLSLWLPACGDSSSDGQRSARSRTSGAGESRSDGLAASDPATRFLRAVSEKDFTAIFEVHDAFQTHVARLREDNPAVLADRLVAEYLQQQQERFLDGSPRDPTHRTLATLHTLLAFGPAVGVAEVQRDDGRVTHFVTLRYSDARHAPLSSGPGNRRTLKETMLRLRFDEQTGRFLSGERMTQADVWFEADGLLLITGLHSAGMGTPFRDAHSVPLFAQVIGGTPPYTITANVRGGTRSVPIRDTSRDTAFRVGPPRQELSFPAAAFPLTVDLTVRDQAGNEDAVSFRLPRGHVTLVRDPWYTAGQRAEASPRGHLISLGLVERLEGRQREGQRTDLGDGANQTAVSTTRWDRRREAADEGVVPRDVDEARQLDDQRRGDGDEGVTPAVADRFRFTGKWNGSHEFDFVMTLRVSGRAASGEIEWTLTAAPPRSHLASRIGAKGTEWVEGTYDPTTRRFELRGTRVSDRTLLGTDQYRLAVSSDGRTISGHSRGHRGRWDHAMEGRAASEVQASTADTMGHVSQGGRRWNAEAEDLTPDEALARLHREIDRALPRTWRVETVERANAEAGLAPQHPNAVPGARRYINHVQWNPAGNRFLFLDRDQSMCTRLLTANADGSDLRMVMFDASHYTWRDNDHILVWTNGGYRLYRDEPLATGTLLWSAPNGHQTYLPGNEWIVTDTYPDAQRQQTIYLYHVPTARRVDLGAFLSPLEYQGDWRCDTHPRLTPDARHICFDSPHAGHGRQMYLLELP